MLSLQLPAVQNYVVHKITDYLSTELDSEITLDHIYFKPFSSLELTGFTIKDVNGDTILTTKELQADLILTYIFANRLSIEDLKLKDAYINYQVYQDSSNFSKIINYFSAEKEEIPDPNKRKLQLRLGKVTLENNHLKFIRHTAKRKEKGVDFGNLDITSLSAVFDNIRLDSVIQADIEKLTLREKSGLHIKELSTNASYSSRQMEFKDLYLAINNSIIQDYLRFDYDSMADFGDFMDKVKITSNLSDAYVDSHDIELFAPTMDKVIFNTEIKKANLKGTVSDIDARNVHFKTAKGTELSGDFTIKGLPDINSTIFDVDLEKLQTTPQDVEYLVPRFANSSSFKLPLQVHKFGNVSFQGKFRGLYNDFIVDGKFVTALGLIQTKSSIAIKNSLTYKGKASSSHFDVGGLIDNKTFGNTGFDLTFDGSNLALKDLNLQVSGKLNNSEIKSYIYESIYLDGHIKNMLLDAKGTVTDRNLNLEYQSSVDWRNADPIYLLDADIQHAALNRLHIVQKDSIIIHAAKINTNLTGSSINSLSGHLMADSIEFSTTRGNFRIGSLFFEAQGDQQNRVLELHSDVVDAKVHGNIDLNTIATYFKALAMRYAPAIGFDNQHFNPQNFILEINIKSFNPVAALLDPNLSLDDGARLAASFSTDDYTASFAAFSPTVTYKGIKLTNLSVEENADEKAFALDITADRINFGDSTYINNITVKNILANDSLRFDIEMSQAESVNYLNVQGNIHFAPNAPAYIKFSSADIVLANEKWILNSDATLRVSKGKVYINKLLFQHGQQSVRLDGILSNENDKLNILFDRFNLKSLDGVTNPLGISLLGNMNGHIEVTSLFKQPMGSANIQTTPIIYNNIPIGQLQLVADIDPNSGVAEIDMQLKDNSNRGVFVEGVYNFYDDDDKLDLTGKLKETDLIIFQPFLKNLVSELHGKANAEIHVGGTFRNPKITGTGNFTNSSFTVNYLKTHYKVHNQSASVENNAIRIKDLVIQDEKGNLARASGTIDLQKLANPYIDVTVNANNVMVLNTTFKDNNLFYGTAFASGDFNFKGFTSAIDIDIDARSEPNTVITLPFNSAMTVEESDFIYFVSKDTTSNKPKQRKKLFEGLTMNMDLNLTPDAELNLQTDLGSLKGNGKGEVALKISSLGDFEMFGDYVIGSGKFHFTAQDFINKYFDLKEGGTIRWTGNPSEAVINVNAIYQQRTAIGPLYDAAGRSGEDERVLAEANMLIKGTLAHPDIAFDIDFPQNPYIKDQLQGFLSDANNVNQQALSLIVRRSFTNSNSNTEIGREVNNTLLSAGTEIAFNQLNNIISQSLNINFFDLNIRSFNDASASVRLLNDRLILTGGITDRTNFQATDLTFFREGVTTDAELTYRLRKDGNLMLRAYNRPYTRNFLIRMNDAEYISAVGLVYRQEFNTLSEFWKKMWRLNLKKDKKNPILEK